MSKVRPIYDLLLTEERKHSNPQDQWRASLPVFVNFLKSQKISYEEFVFTLA